MHLLDIVNKSKDLQSVAGAISLNARSLAMTALFGMIIIYIYSIIGFAFLQDSYSATIATYENDACSTLLNCWITGWNDGLRKGDLGGVLMMTEKKNLQPMFVAFEFSYFVVVVTVLLNVIFGIIVDTFAQLRHNNLETLHDMENSCFICSIDRFTFDRVAQGFEEHIKMDHYMWNYFYLSVHLREKPVSEHSTWEADVFSKMTRSDTAFFPISKALVLHSMKKDEEAAHANVEHSVNEIQKQMEAIGNQVQQLQGQQQTRFLDLQHALQGDCCKYVQHYLFVIAVPWL